MTHKYVKDPGNVSAEKLVNPCPVNTLYVRQFHFAMRRRS